MVEQNPGHFTALAEAWRSAGLSDAVPERIDRAVERIAEMYADHRKLEDEPNRVARLLARGELTMSEALAQFLTQPHSERPTRTLISSAVQVVLADLLLDLRAMQLFDELRQVHDDLIGEAYELVPVVRGIESDADAMRAGGKVREAWAKLLGLAERRQRIIDAYSRAGRLRLTPLPPSHVPSDAQFYRDPDKLPRYFGRTVPLVRRFADTLANGAGPALLSAEELSEMYPKQPAKLSAVEPTGTRWERDVHGAVTGEPGAMVQTASGGPPPPEAA